MCRPFTSTIRTLQMNNFHMQAYGVVILVYNFKSAIGFGEFYVMACVQVLGAHIHVVCQFSMKLKVIVCQDSNTVNVFMQFISFHIIKTILYNEITQVQYIYIIVSCEREKIKFRYVMSQSISSSYRLSVYQLFIVKKYTLHVIIVEKKYYYNWLLIDTMRVFLDL